MKPETFAVAVIAFLALYAAWTLADRLNDPRCHLEGHRSGALVCTDKTPPIVLPADAKDRRAV